MITVASAIVIKDKNKLLQKEKVQGKKKKGKKVQGEPVGYSKN